MRPRTSPCIRETSMQKPMLLTGPESGNWGPVIIVLGIYIILLLNIPETYAIGRQNRARRPTGPSGRKRTSRRRRRCIITRISSMCPRIKSRRAGQRASSVSNARRPRRAETISGIPTRASSPVPRAREVARRAAAKCSIKVGKAPRIRGITSGPSSGLGSGRNPNLRGRADLSRPTSGASRRWFWPFFLLMSSAICPSLSSKSSIHVFTTLVRFHCPLK